MENYEFKNMRRVDLMIIISFTSGRMYCDINDIKSFSDYLSSYYNGKKKLTFDMMREFIYYFHPYLRGVGKEEVSDVNKFIFEQKEKFGNELPIRPIFSSDVDLMNLDKDVCSDKNR